MTNTHTSLALCIMNNHEQICYLFAFHILEFKDWTRKEGSSKTRSFSSPSRARLWGWRNGSAGEDGV